MESFFIVADARREIAWLLYNTMQPIHISFHGQTQLLQIFVL